MSNANYSSEHTPPRPYRDFQTRYPEVAGAYETLGQACHENGPLEAKTRELVKLGIALGAGLEGASRAHVRLGLQTGCSPDDLRHAALLATTTLGFPAMMRSMQWVEDSLRHEQAASSES